jgi:hypothetical protein
MLRISCTRTSSPPIRFSHSPSALLLHEPCPHHHAHINHPREYLDSVVSSSHPVRLAPLAVAPLAQHLVAPLAMAHLASSHLHLFVCYSLSPRGRPAAFQPAYPGISSRHGRPVPVTYTRTLMSHRAELLARASVAASAI